MSLLTASIPNMVNGISQQPQALRSTTQADRQVNGLSSVSEGLRKRPAFRHIAKILDTKVSNGFIHLINRDVQERYAVIIHDGGIKVFDIDGTEKTVNAPDGLGYLGATNPKENIDAVTVADFTFIVNKEVNVETTAAVSPERKSEALVWVKQGDYGATYKVTVDGTTVSYKAPDGADTYDAQDITTNNIVAQLVSKLNSSGLTGYTFNNQGSSIQIIKDSGDLKVTSTDNVGDTAITIAGPKVQRFSGLPASGTEAFEVEVTGDQTSNFDNYYVKYSDGVWTETIKQGLKIALDPAVMPHALVREADGTFTFRQIGWSERKVGDDDSNPLPSFVGASLNGMFFHRNRLGFISGENIVMSRAGDFFNFFKSTAMELLDDDPIDVGVSHTKVSILRHAVPFAETLLLFSDQTQFQLGRADILTPSTISVNQTTEYEASLRAKPGAAGRFIYFMVNRGKYSGLREYYVDMNTEVSEAADITGHVPAYIPSDVFKITATSNEDALVFLSDKEPNRLYVYMYYWSGQEKLQSAWSHWEVDAQANILNCDFIESDLFLVVEREDGVYLEVCSLEPGYKSPGNELAFHLDRLVDESQITSLTYNSADGSSSFNLPYKIDTATDSVTAVSSAGGNLKTGLILDSTLDNSGTTTKVTVPNKDLTGEPLFAGVNYRFRYKLSQLMLREGQQGAVSAITSGRTQVRKLSFQYANSGYFQVEVTPFRRQTYQYVYTGRKVGSAENLIGDIAIGYGSFDVPVLAQNNNVDIEIISDSFLPLSLLGAEWECFFNTRSKRA